MEAHRVYRTWTNSSWHISLLKGLDVFCDYQIQVVKRKTRSSSWWSFLLNVTHTQSWDKYSQHSKMTLKKGTNVFTILSPLVCHCEYFFFLLDLLAGTSGLQNSCLTESYKTLSFPGYSKSKISTKPQNLSPLWAHSFIRLFTADRLQMLLSCLGSGKPKLVFGS